MIQPFGDAVAADNGDDLVGLVSGSVLVSGSTGLIGGAYSIRKTIKALAVGGAVVADNGDDVVGLVTGSVLGQQSTATLRPAITSGNILGNAITDNRAPGGIR